MNKNIRDALCFCMIHLIALAAIYILMFYVYLCVPFEAWRWTAVGLWVLFGFCFMLVPEERRQELYRDMEDMARRMF